MTAPRRTALVTGAASGIGAAIARMLRRQGARLVLLDRDGVGLERIAHEVDGVALPVDVADAAAVDSAIGSLDGLDVLVNAAGIATETRIDDDLAVVRRTLEVNLLGVLTVTRACVPLLRRSPSPRVLNIGSVQGDAAAEGVIGYAASKGGVHAVTRALAVDLAADGVLVNALAPGFIDTPMAVLPDGRTEYQTEWFQTVYVDNARIPLRRPGSADEVAAAAEFFVSESNTYVTGVVMAVDGGMRATF